MKSDRRYTILLVPEGGAGEVRQISVSARHVQAAAATIISALILITGLAAGQALTWPRAREADALRAENEQMRAEVTDARQQLSEIAALIDRVRAYDARLRDLSSRGLLPGFGPLDPEEAAAYQQWLAGEAPEGPPLQGPLDVRAADLVEEINILVPLLSEGEDWMRDRTENDGALPQIWPVDSGILSAHFGWRHHPILGTWKFHYGVDLSASFGEPIYATASGVVIRAEWAGGYGNMVEIDHGDGVISRYGHSSQLLVEAGDEVQTGEIIALVGSTGLSTGPHLHYELFLDGVRVDPLDWLPVD